MVKKILISSLLFVSISCAQLVGPKAVVQQKNHDFGIIEQGETVSTSFIIVNSGGDLLKILDVKATCGCTAAQPDKNELMPGESTKIEVSFNSKGRRGPQEKQVNVTTNDPDNKVLVLTIKCDINIPEKKEVKLEGARIIFSETQHNYGKVEEDKKYSHIFKFANNGTATLDIKDVKASCGCTATLLSNSNFKPGESGTLKVELDTKGRNGRMSRSITIESNDPIEPNKVLTIFAEIVK